MLTVRPLHLPFRAWLGIAILQVSPTLISSTLTVSHQALKFRLSLLRIPIPPRPHISDGYIMPAIIAKRSFTRPLALA